MSAANQTSEDLLLRYAAGKLRPAPALVVASHLAISQSSRRLVAAFESIGGGLLERESMADLPPDLFERTLARLGTPSAVQAPPPVRTHVKPELGFALPAPLARRAIGPWRWLGPGLRGASIDMAEDPDHKLILLRGQAGRALPEHGHSGEELNLVLKGSFHDEGGRYVTGDLIHEDADSGHTPVVSDDGECICLIAIEGRMKFRNWLARIAQPFIGL